MSYTLTMTVGGVTVTRTSCPATVTFTRTDALANEISWLWEFGDGSSSSDVSPIHTYTMPGVYSVKLTGNAATNDGGCGGPFYGTTTLTVTRQVSIYTLDKCYRIGLNKEQGYGPSEYSGTYWPVVPVGIGGRCCYDTTNDMPHYVVFDTDSQLFYEISEPTGPTSSGLTRKWTDDDYSATANEIATEIHFSDMTAEKPHYNIEHLETHIYTEAYDKTNRGANGYDANGQRNNQQFDLELYKDGEQTTYDARTLDIPGDGDLCYDRKISGSSLRTILKTAAGEYKLTGFDQYFISKDRAKEVDNSTLAESANQLALASNLQLWYDRGPTLLKNLVSGSTATGSITACDGPDGRTSSAMSFTTSPAFGTPTTTNGMIVFFYNGTIAVKKDASTISMIDHSSGAFTASGVSWKLCYSSLTGSNLAGAITLVPTGTAKVFGLRIFNSLMIAADLLYLYNDVRYNSGNNVCPLF